MTIAILFFTTYTLCKWSFNMRGLYICLLVIPNGRILQRETRWKGMAAICTSYNVNQSRVLTNNRQLFSAVGLMQIEWRLNSSVSLNVCIYSVPARKYCRQKWTQELQAVGATYRVHFAQVPTMDGVVYSLQDGTLFRV